MGGLVEEVGVPDDGYAVQLGDLLEARGHQGAPRLHVRLRLAQRVAREVYVFQGWAVLEKVC